MREAIIYPYLIAVKMPTADFADWFTGLKIPAAERVLIAGRLSVNGAKVVVVGGNCQWRFTISAGNNKGINSLCRVLGTPETISAGVYLHKQRGKIARGESLITLYSESKSKLRDGMRFIKEFKPIKIK